MTDRGSPYTDPDTSTLELPLASETGRRARQKQLQTQAGGLLRRLVHLLDFRGAPTPVRTGELGALEQLCREALSQRNKIAGLVAIAKVGDAYNRLDEAGRDAFFHRLLINFAPNPAEIQSALQAWNATQGSRIPELLTLTQSLTSPRVHLFQAFNTIPNGMKFLVDLRAHLESRLEGMPDFAMMEYELRSLLETFFNIGFLKLERINWSSPASLLEKLMTYEAVHRIANWRDLKHRLLTDRACYAFLHPAMPDEPVIFVEVALVKGMADNIQRLLDPDAPDLNPGLADTAVFYSISNAQKGLRGIHFGNLLIKQVTMRLRAEWPNLKTFVTLSPLPRFRQDFLDPALRDASISRYFTKDERQVILRLTGDGGEDASPEALATAVHTLLDMVNWHQRTEITHALRHGLMRAVKSYLTSPNAKGQVRCPVGHFHASNGAALARINWLADTSAKGFELSAGLMVNYLYDLTRFEAQQEDYQHSGLLHLEKAVRDL